MIMSMYDYINGSDLKSFVPQTYANNPLRHFYQSSVSGLPSLGDYVAATSVPINLNTNNMLGNQVLGIPTSGSFSGVNLGTDGMFGNKLVGSTPTTAVTGLDLPKGTGFGDLAFSDKALLGLGAFNSALSAINSYKANKLGRQQLAFAKDSFNRNFEAQKGITNSQLADRQSIRYKVNPADNMSVADYMAKYGVK